MDMALRSHFAECLGILPRCAGTVEPKGLQFL
jgi:hypothetical protein